MPNIPQRFILITLIALIALGLPFETLAHGVDESTRAFLLQNTGVQIIPFLYIGAKHMVTGYDHLLFLVGVLFFLYRSRDVLLYVSMFTLGHSITLLFGVMSDIEVNAYLIDAIIGLSVVYKGFDNLGGFQRLLGKSPNAKLAVLIFGLLHGFGLATKLQEFQLPDDGLIARNKISAASVKDWLKENWIWLVGILVLIILIIVVIKYLKNRPEPIIAEVILKALGAFT